jgi:ankyrin repeat protein
LPETLDGTYEQSLRRIDKQKRDFACRLFQCLVVSKRPLRVEELAELFAIQPDVDTIPTFDVRCRPENPEEFVLSACSTLVAVVNNRGQKIVQFSHFSVREYLTSDRIAISEHVSRFHVLPRPAHALLARACLSVLLQLDDCIVRDEIQEFPLASYAAQYWVDHAQFDDIASEIQRGMEFLFDKDKPHFAAWHRLYNIDNQYPYSMFPHPIPHLAPLYYAALCGFRHLAEHLVDAHPQDVNARGGRRLTALHAAVYKGHLSVAMLLLERSADIGSRDFQSRTSLHIASYYGHADVVSLLINRGADLNARSDSQETPLYLASKQGRQDAARLLLEHKADANRRNARGWAPLHAASWEGHHDMVRLLLAHSAVTDPLTNDGWTPLHLALRKGDVHCVRLLLDHGADGNYPDSNGRTPLHLASRDGRDDVVQLLRGADKKCPDSDGWISLHLVAQDGHKYIVRLLPNHGADADSHDLKPLHLLSAWELLFNRNAHPNHSDGLYWTLLQLASQKGFIYLSSILLPFNFLIVSFLKLEKRFTHMILLVMRLLLARYNAIM